MRVLLLWDVDDTLIASGGVNEEIYLLAFTLLTGHPPETRIPIAGLTERGLLDRVLTVNGLDPAAYPWPDQHAALIEACARNRENLARLGHVLPGVPAALSAVDSRPEVVSSLLTGNCVENALTKLGVFGLEGWVDLEVGGFGSDSLVRADLVAIAQSKAAAKYGFDPACDSTVLVGDTPLDVEAGRSGGAWVVAVATGRSPVSDLRAAGADAVFADLRDLDAFLGVVEGMRDRGSTGPRPGPGP